MEFLDFSGAITYPQLCLSIAIGSAYLSLCEALKVVFSKKNENLDNISEAYRHNCGMPFRVLGSACYIASVLNAIGVANCVVLSSCSEYAMYTNDYQPAVAPFFYVMGRAFFTLANVLEQRFNKIGSSPELA